jgi:ornithine cyclodeaminase
MISARRSLPLQDWQSCVEGADIVVEASRLSAPTPMLKTEWIKKGALVIPYGTMSAVELDLTDIMDKIVVDDWGQCKTASSAPFAPMLSRQAHRENASCELGQIVAGVKTGRQRDE